MNNTHLCLLLIALSASCSSGESQTSPVDVRQAAEAPETVEQQASTPVETPAATSHSSGLSGTVTETMNSGGYTYVLLDTGSEKVWAAGPETSMAVGASVSVQSPMAMPAFHSSTLDRTFEMIYFAAALTDAPALPAHGAPAVASPHADSAAPDAETAADGTTIAKAEGGNTVEEIFKNKDELVGKEVLIRGKVVKYSAGIMDRNWLHIQDGTGSEGTNDLTVTTDETAAAGDTVLVRGVLTKDKDFGYGYKYAVIVEDAKITVE